MYSGIKQSYQIESANQQYINVLADIAIAGTPLYNDRTGKRCWVHPDTVVMTYPVDSGIMSIDTTRKVPWKSAIAEILGYLRGVCDAQEMADLGTKTWFANANETPAWLNNPNRLGENDMGKVYGYWLHNWPSSTQGTVNQLEKVYNNLKMGIDDRGEILMMLNPGETDTGCLRPCMYSHTFRLVNGVLDLTSVQRSWDGPLGGAFNMVQCHVLLALMAQITNTIPGKVTHVITNAHIYEDQRDIFLSQHLTRGIDNTLAPVLEINPAIQSLDDVLSWVTVDDFNIINYEPQPAINYPFSC